MAYCGGDADGIINILSNLNYNNHGGRHLNNGCSFMLAGKLEC